MTTVGYAALSIIPSVRGFSRELQNQLVAPAEGAGTQAGEAAGAGFSDKLKMGVAAGAAVAGALLVKGLTDAMGQADVTSKLQAQLGASSKDAARFGKVAGKLYSSGVTDSFEGAADAIKSIMQSGIAPPGATNKQLQQLATKASDVANVFGQDLGGVTNAVSQMMRTGLAKNSTEAFDLITAGFQGGTDKAGDFLDTINEYGTQFRKAGLDGASSIGLLNQAIKGGARDADVAADAIKEFSIRAVDGSDSSAAGFKALSLNADDMAAKFAKGGKAANGVLDLTLDKLRNVKDPVKQSQIAVQLFGTQAEDLGKALFAMDPSKAADGLGKFGGAADKAGKTIRSGPSHEISVFTRTLQQGFVSFVGGTLIPVISDVAHWLNDNLGPAVRVVADAFSGTVEWFKEWGVWLTPLGILVGGLTVALTASAIASGVAAAATGTWATITGLATAVTGAWSTAMGLLNAVMALNPFVLVAIAIAALVAGIVIAYKRSETFRTIVQAAFKAVGDAALWLWHNAISPVIGWIVAGFKLWWAGVKLYFNFVRAAFRAVGDAAMWLWNKAIWPVIGFIIGGFKLWWAGVKLYFGYVKAGFRAVGAAASWLWNKAITPAFNGIRSAISTVWNTGIKPTFNMLKTAVGKVGDAFRLAKDAIKVAWDKVKGIAKAPVAFVVNTVYNSGIVPVWNKVAGAFGAPKLEKMKAFATGGVLPGYTPGRDVHLAALSGGEAVMRPEWTRAVGPGYVNSMNAAARGGGIRGVQRALGLPGFADGGIFGWVKGAASKGVDLAKSGVSWLKDGLKESALAGMNKLVKPLIDKISGSASLYKAMVTRVPKRMLTAIFDFSETADKKLGDAGIGGKGFKSGLSWARTQHGKRYQWGGNGNPSWDCSGFLSAIESVIRGQKPHRRWATGAFAGRTAPSGWVLNRRSPYMIGITNSGVGHTAGTLNGVNVESRGGDGVLVGKRARSYRSSLFSDIYGFKYDAGGWLQPGLTMAVNKTAQPEAILTPVQWSAVAALAAQGAASVSAPQAPSARGGRFEAGQHVTLMVQDGPTLRAYVKDVADGSVDASLTRVRRTASAGRKQ
ncbi:phage tail tape measure protein [Streptomyces europaeiscabiei]|uniref:phage tail tape measure protein n=1 Tax=Streptomyces europaeiscabiei TaxID=146819 RepID=UPI0029A33F4E|nr:phage tail tape measure protein [Streptomyces europaeiscabiei]MDX2770635.1 phage tail tape measure protein [Streptomyces europaeiscabiei]